MSVAQRREREREQRRAAILEAAERVFRGQGFAAATMEQVASEAQLSKGTLYLYFKSKDELFMALASEVIDELALRVGGAVNESTTGVQAFRDIVESLVEIACRHPDTIRSALTWLALGDRVDTDSEGFKQYRARVDKVQAALMQCITRGQADGTIRVDIDPLLTVLRVWPALLSNVVVYLNAAELQRRFQRDVDRETLLPGTIDLLVRGISAPPSHASESSS